MCFGYDYKQQARDSVFRTVKEEPAIHGVKKLKTQSDLHLKKGRRVFTNLLSQSRKLYGVDREELVDADYGDCTVCTSVVLAKFVLDIYYDRVNDC